MSYLPRTPAIQDMGQDGRMAALRHRRNGETAAQSEAADAPA
jgi:hypothetical protein